MSIYWRRIGAYVIDLSIIGMISQIAMYLFNPFALLTGSNLAIDIFIFFVFLFESVAIAVAYNVGCYHFFKFPLGKLLMRVEVLNHRGRRVSTKTFFIREVNKFTYMYATFGLYAPYQFLFKVVKKEQTFHDRQAGTHIYM